MVGREYDRSSAGGVLDVLQSQRDVGPLDVFHCQGMNDLK